MNLPDRIEFGIIDDYQVFTSETTPLFVVRTFKDKIYTDATIDL